MSKIEKTSDVSPAGRDAIRRAIQELRPYDSNDLVAGLISKLFEIAEAPPSGSSAHPENSAPWGAATPSMKSEGEGDWEVGSGQLEQLYKVESDWVRENGPMSVTDRAQINKASRSAQLAYLREMSPAAADAFERHAQFNAQANASGPPPSALAKSDDHDRVGELNARAEKLRKADPELSPYEAQMQALRENPELGGYAA